MRFKERLNPGDRPQLLGEYGEGSRLQLLGKIGWHDTAPLCDQCSDIGYALPHKPAKPFVPRHRRTELSRVSRSDSAGERFAVGDDTIEIKD